MSKIYCNPIQQSNIPRAFGGNMSADGFVNEPCDFRDSADPEVLFHDGKWYMYPSQGQAYVSDDLTHWTYQPIDIEIPLGYAPGVTKRNGKFYITSSPYYKDGVPRIFEAPSPLGPFRFIGTPVDMDGNVLKHYLDPALFTDDDGRMFLYWGCAPEEGGIYGMEVDAEQPWKGISPVQTLIKFNGDNYWERMGEYGEVVDFGWNEGVSMYKYDGRYYLQHSANGTVNRHYTIACYLGKSPLGPVEPPKAPMILNPHGMVCGTGHGGMFPGPDGEPWVAYSCLIHRVHHFERRAGIDPVHFNADGTPYVNVSSTPRFVEGGDMGLVPVSCFKIARASSALPGSGSFFAIDDCSHTFWAPHEDDAEPVLTVNLRNTFPVHSFRIIWAELNLDYDNGIVPEPIKYKVVLKDKNGAEQYTFDASCNEEELNVNFQCLEKPVNAAFAELHILKNPQSRLHIGVTDFSVFAPPSKYTR